MHGNGTFGSLDHERRRFLMTYSYPFGFTYLTSIPLFRMTQETPLMNPPSTCLLDS
ncbi:Hypothetical protein FKW44_010516 [Caligus rogercresseyi]|uniref:Uncharacterized protein n=1 Tax=Caligus rogercresseyi TaxID=217165 RepID=A0A7T8HH13_CALRO|nr:Hypothetical protein FKW44_010516 [Caligus rogercresseyi]